VQDRLCSPALVKATASDCGLEKCELVMITSAQDHFSMYSGQAYDQAVASMLLFLKHNMIWHQDIRTWLLVRKKTNLLNPSWLHDPIHDIVVWSDLVHALFVVLKNHLHGLRSLNSFILDVCVLRILQRGNVSYPTLHTIMSVVIFMFSWENDWQMLLTCAAVEYWTACKQADKQLGKSSRLMKQRRLYTFTHRHNASSVYFWEHCSQGASRTTTESEVTEGSCCPVDIYLLWQMWREVPCRMGGGGFHREGSEMCLIHCRCN
jgi:hypothetical protein